MPILVNEEQIKQIILLGRIQDDNSDDESNGCKLDKFGDYANEEIEVEE